MGPALTRALLVSHRTRVRADLVGVDQHVSSAHVSAWSAVGDGVDTSWVGQRVWAFTGLGGGYAEQAVAPAVTLVPLPAGVSPADAVTLGSSGAVAHFGLRHAHFAPGESVLVRGAAGGIGS